MRWLLGLAICAWTASLSVAQPNPVAKPPAVLEKSCGGCHGEGKSERNFLGESATKFISEKVVVPGKPKDSLLFKRLAVKKDMPPPDEKGIHKPTSEEIAEVEKWIESLPVVGPQPEAAKKSGKFVSPLDLYRAARADLQGLRTERDRKATRYFSLANVHNNPNFDEEYRRTLQAAVTKLINSISLLPIVVPRKVKVKFGDAETDDVLLAINLEDLGWVDCKMWSAVLSAYPYGLTYDDHFDKELRTAAKDVTDMTGTEQPILRADWFTITAARPPLYHTLLYATLLAHKEKDKVIQAGLRGGSLDLKTRKVIGGESAMTAEHLEAYLHVDVAKNFRTGNNILRAGFSESGVSRQNRMIERHELGNGAYWKSYDFLSGAKNGNLVLRPLGPSLADHPYPDQAFQHDGGEIIFTLPNGLQGYLLVDGKGRRIDEGPTDVVEDSRKISGSVAIVNGLSCMNCHSDGSKAGGNKSLDYLEKAAVKKFGGDVRDKVERLYDTEQIRKRLKEDEERFLAAMKKAVGGLRKDGDKDDEPIGAVSAKMNKDRVTLDLAAAELGLVDPAKLKTAIENNPELLNLGLGPLAEPGHTIDRRDWEANAKGNTFCTVFQETARLMKLGSPLSVK